MSERMLAAFAKARDEGRAALIPYVTAGYPRLEDLPAVLLALRDGGADIIEIGIPFSDPLADGPILQKAASHALEQGTKVKDILATVAEVSAQLPPLVFLTYINPVYRYGFREFSEASHRAGIEGFIIPDLPWIEAAPLRQSVENAGITMIPLVAPTSRDAHLEAIKSARGFIYGVSVTGVTGARTEVDAGVFALVDRVKSHVVGPLAIGFGISTPAQARAVGRVADGVIVGSALVRAIGERPDEAALAAGEFVSHLRQGLNTQETSAR